MKVSFRSDFCLKFVIFLSKFCSFCFCGFSYANGNGGSYVHPQPVDSVENSVDNYFEDALGLSGKIIRWNKKLITVYIPDKYSDEIQLAFSEWEKSADGLFCFKKNDNVSDADIVIIIKNEKSIDLEGVTKNYPDGNFLLKSEVILHSKNSYNQPFTSTQLYMLALHEIGHSLGIVGHSSDSADVMSVDKLENYKKISPRDAKTLKMVYSYCGEPLMDSRTILKNKLQLQQKVVETNPNDKFQNLILGDLYKNLGDYSNAIETYKRVICLDQKHAQAYYSVGYCYYQVRKPTNALLYFKKSMLLEPNNVAFLHAYIKVSSEIGNISEAKKYLNKYLKKHPESADNPLIKRSIENLGR